jgi:hypothetical protein
VIVILVTIYHYLHAKRIELFDDSVEFKKKPTIDYQVFTFNIFWTSLPTIQLEMRLSREVMVVVSVSKLNIEETNHHHHLS